MDTRLVLLADRDLILAPSQDEDLNSLAASLAVKDIEDDRSHISLEENRESSLIAGWFWSVLWGFR